ncbi:effector-associated constant component EACC1 [Streptomyces sp. NPDC004788]
MSTTHTDPAPGYRISVVDEDPLRARREARELLAALVETDPQAALDVPARPVGTSEAETFKGGPVADLLGLVFGGGSLAAAAIQIWLARVPQRTVVVTRPDGATLTISGKQARADDAQIERFLSGNAGPAGEGDEQDGPGAA